MTKTSIIIPTRNEVYRTNSGQTMLEKTVAGVYENATGEIEVIVAFDGPPYQALPDYPNLIRMETGRGARKSTSTRRLKSHGQVPVQADSHCMLIGLREPYYAMETS